jgi:hypothetical protein
MGKENNNPSNNKRSRETENNNRNIRPNLQQLDANPQDAVHQDPRLAFSPIRRQPREQQNLDIPSNQEQQRDANPQDANKQAPRPAFSPIRIQPREQQNLDIPSNQEQQQNLESPPREQIARGNPIAPPLLNNANPEILNQINREIAQEIALNIDDVDRPLLPELDENLDPNRPFNLMPRNNRQLQQNRLSGEQRRGELGQNVNANGVAVVTPERKSHADDLRRDPESRSQGR